MDNLNEVDLVSPVLIIDENLYSYTVTNGLLQEINIESVRATNSRQAHSLIYHRMHSIKMQDHTEGGSMYRLIFVDMSRQQKLNEAKKII